MNVRSSVLANGITVVTERMDHVETASLGIWVGSGSRHERPEEHGLSHLLEHMAFKGTTTRSARDIAEQIESVGGDLNAATSAESTAYYARVLKADVPLALDLLADILLNSTFDATELGREKGVIVQEIAAAQDSPEDVVFDLAHELAYPQQPLGRTILGTPDSVRRIGPDHLRAHLANHYRGRAMVLAGAGAIDHDDIVRRAEERLGPIVSGEPPAADAARYRGGASRSELEFEQTHLVVAFKGPSYCGDDYYGAQVLSGLLGGGMSSRLFQEAREQRGLCYSIYAFHWGFADTGMFGVHTATGAETVGELGEVIAEQVRRVAERPAPAEEVSRAKVQIKAGILMSLESSSARASRMARQTLALGRTLTTEELIGKIDAVTPASIRALAERILTGSTATIAGVGALGGGVTIDALARKFASPAIRAAE